MGVDTVMMDFVPDGSLVNPPSLTALALFSLWCEFLFTERHYGANADILDTLSWKVLLSQSGVIVANIVA